MECHEFFPRDEAIKHENEGECDQCSKWLGCEKKVQIHKLKEHKTINEKVNMDLQESNNIIIEKDNISNEINTKEKQVTERLKIRSDTQERNNRTTNIQVQNSNKKNNRKNQKMVTIKGLENNKKEQRLLENIRVETLKYLKRIPPEPFKSIEEKHQKWDKDMTNRLDKLKTIKDTPIGKNKATHKFFQYDNPKDRNNSVNITLERRHKKENSYKPNTKEYITKERQMMTLFIPKLTIYVQNKTNKIIEMNQPDQKNINTIKHGKLQIWKLLDIRIILYGTNKIIEIGTKPEKHKKGNIKESKIHKEWKIKKLTKRTRMSCKARKLKKLIILNYTERGKRQQFHKYWYITFILYNVITYYTFLHINLYISIILIKLCIQYLTYINVTIYISLKKKI